MSLDDVEVRCVVCGDAVSVERKRRRSITCTDAHAKIRNRYLRARAEARKCRYCGQPSTPEERKSFKRWREWEKKQIEAGVANEC
jgi:hypothetical protein